VKAAHGQVRQEHHNGSARSATDKRLNLKMGHPQQTTGPERTGVGTRRKEIRQEKTTEEDHRKKINEKRGSAS